MRELAKERCASPLKSEVTQKMHRLRGINSGHDRSHRLVSIDIKIQSVVAASVLSHEVPSIIDSQSAVVRETAILFDDVAAPTHMNSSRRSQAGIPITTIAKDRTFVSSRDSIK